MVFSQTQCAIAELDKLLRFIARHQITIIASPIPASGHIPPAFLRTLVELERAVNDTITAEKAGAKKMAPVKAKALNGMKQTLRKKTKEFELYLQPYSEVSRATPCVWRLWLLILDQDSAAYTAAYDAANVAPVAPRAPRRAAATQDGQADDGDFMTIGRGGRALNLTADGVFRTLREIVEQRGKKVRPSSSYAYDTYSSAQNTDRAETIRILMKLLEVSVTTYQRIRVYLALVPARLDYSQNLSHMPQDSWVSCREELDALVTLLLNEPDYIVQDQVEEYDDMVDREPEVVDGKKQRVKVSGNLVGLVENLDNEVSPFDEVEDSHR